MGYAPKELIEKAGEYLLQKLTTENPIKYSKIYNDTTISDDVVNFVPVAALQLERQGIAKRRALPNDPPLPDMQDFEIFLKKADAKPQFVGMDL